MAVERGVGDGREERKGRTKRRENEDRESASSSNGLAFVYGA